MARRFEYHTAKDPGNQMDEGTQIDLSDGHEANADWPKIQTSLPDRTERIRSAPLQKRARKDSRIDRPKRKTWRIQQQAQEGKMPVQAMTVKRNGLS
jgi:erythromycin esterase-like protein